ncbi:hypothetical protein HID58_015141 [Brassica napus]|uniref:Serine aminopeptidase S33 domain-containing protein n=1 Tax=Brassica napus TaxID=3708 RepID=A0ABQ8DJ58_BRANA|nr:hypothetical protein HID58_015141 [Brassica napus]
MSTPNRPKTKEEKNEVGTTKTFIYRENRRTRVFSSMALRITDGICPIFSSGSSRRAHNLHFSHLKSTRRLTSVATERRRYRAKVTATVNPYSNTEAARPEERKSLRDFLSEAENFYTSDSGDGGPPRWFSPLQCSSHAPGSPLLLYIPGMDGTGLGLIRQHRRLGEIFDVWCLHFPAMDRTPARDIVKLIERTVRSEYYRVPNRPIYIVGESVGACLALDVAASNPDIDIVLILANPVTRVNNFMLQPLSSLLETLPDEVPSLIEDNFGFREGKVSSPCIIFQTLIRIFPKNTLLWKLQLLKSASASAKSHIGRDQWLPNNGDIERLRFALPKCEVREFYNNGQFLFLEDGVDLATIIKISYYYRRGKILDYISDYTLPTPYELKEFEQSQRLLTAATAPVFLSTLDNGTVVRSLEGIPSEGPVLYVGNHMLFGLELRPAAIHFLKERNILLRGLAHPVMFTKKIGSKLPDMQMFDSARIIGAVPVSNMNFYKLLRSKAHVVLYPGGVREALHRKGEEYKLFWPEHSEFVRIASKFGARIIPFGAVGEDDLCQMVLDYNDQMKIPFLKNLIEEITHDTIKLRNDEEGELRNQDLHMPGFIPKIPGRYYVYFGKPIETKGREKELHDKEKAHEVYLEVKSEVERCMTYLKTKRETDPYRNILPRLLYYLSHGFSSQVPTFDLPNH